MFNPFGREIRKVYGPYVCNIGTGQRRMMAFVFEDGGRTSMPYARWLMTQELSRVLGPNEHVDHVNEDSLDDRIDNSWESVRVAEEEM